MKEYIIPEDTLKAIIGYMQRQPYEEVANVIAAIGKVREIKEGEDDTPDSETDNK